MTGCSLIHSGTCALQCALFSRRSDFTSLCMGYVCIFLVLCRICMIYELIKLCYVHVMNILCTLAPGAEDPDTK